jgi:3-oxoadipate enol-lactonase
MSGELSYFTRDGLRIRFQVDGREGAPWMLLSNSLGTNLGMWQPQMAALLEKFRVLRYDTRGHGLSDVPPHAASMAELGQDVLALLDFLDIAETRFCGLSMGGMIGMWLGINHPDRIVRLALCNTAPRIAPPELWNTRIALVNANGMESIAANVINRWFTENYQAHAPTDVASVKQMLLDTIPAGYAASCAAIRDMDQRDQLHLIGLPTLVISGTHDAATPPQDGKLIVERVAGARYVELDAAHLSNWERTAEFNSALMDFMTKEYADG